MAMRQHMTIPVDHPVKEYSSRVGIKVGWNSSPGLIMHLSGADPVVAIEALHELCDRHY